MEVGDRASLPDDEMRYRCLDPHRNQDSCPFFLKKYSVGNIR